MPACASARLGTPPQSHGVLSGPSQARLSQVQTPFLLVHPMSRGVKPAFPLCGKIAYVAQRKLRVAFPYVRKLKSFPCVIFSMLARV